MAAINRSFKEFSRVYGKAFLGEQGTLPDKMYENLKGCRSMVENYIKKRPYTIDIYDPRLKDLKAGKDMTGCFCDSVAVRVENMRTGDVQEEELFDVKSRGPIVRQIYEFVNDVTALKSRPIEEFVQKTRRRFYQYLEVRKNKNNDNLPKMIDSFVKKD